MTLEIAWVFALVLVALVLFATEAVRVDVTAIGVMAALMVSGVLAPEAAVAGFSSVATLTVGSLFVLTAGLRHTGAIDELARAFKRVGGLGPVIALATLMVVIGAVSAFVNNTAAVAIFIPVALALARDTGVSPSKLLIPLSFMSMFGGVCTLIGTSTNLIVDSIAREEGIRPFGLFEFAPLGLVLFAAGFLYLATVGRRLLPARRPPGDLVDSYAMAPFLLELEIGDESPLLGERIDDNAITTEFDAAVLELVRNGFAYPPGAASIRLVRGDVLRVRAARDDIPRLLELPGIEQRRGDQEPLTEEDLRTERDSLVEVVLAPDSNLVGRTVSAVQFPRRFGAQVVAVRHGGQVRHEKLGTRTLRGGESLLLEVDRTRLAGLHRGNHFVLVSELEPSDVRRRHLPVALGTIVAVVALAATGVIPIVTAAVAGAVFVVVTGCVRVDEAYEAINWQILFVLAGMLSLGVALEETGAANLIADGLITTVSPLGLTAMVAAFFLVSFSLTELVSNNATAALLAPVAIEAAALAGVDPRPLLMAVTFAASLSFLTPMGYQTNLLVYGPGNYRYTDFARVGIPLSLICWALSTLLIPVIWPG